MAELIAIVGDSGSGKSTSIRNLDPEKTFIISTTGKRPGVKGAKKRYPDFKINRETKEMTGNFYTSSNIDSIKKMMQIVNTKMPEVSVRVIDDFQYLQAFEAMARVDEKGYGKFTDMAKHADFVEKLLPTDIIDDDDVLAFVSDNIEKLKICNISDEFKEKVKELAETTRRDEENVVNICNVLGIKIAAPVEKGEETEDEKSEGAN